MNEKLQYASMLEIPVNSCNVTYAKLKRKKSKRKPDAEQVKRQLLEKVNSSVERLETEQEQPCAEQVQVEQAPSTPKRKRSFTLVTAQLVIIGVLVAVIFLTNALYQGGGISVFFKSVFGGQTSQTVKNFDEFAPVVALDGASVSLDEGVATLSGSGSVYSPADGVVKSVVKLESGKYQMEIAHSSTFSSVLTGLDYAYSLVGDTVYGNIPVGYLSGGDLQMCFCGSDGQMIVDYQIVDGTVLWAV